MKLSKFENDLSLQLKKADLDLLIDTFKFFQMGLELVNCFLIFSKTSELVLERSLKQIFQRIVGLRNITVNLPFGAIFKAFISNNRELNKPAFPNRLLPQHPSVFQSMVPLDLPSQQIVSCIRVIIFLESDVATVHR